MQTDRGVSIVECIDCGDIMPLSDNPAVMAAELTTFVEVHPDCGAFAITLKPST